MLIGLLSLTIHNALQASSILSNYMQDAKIEHYDNTGQLKFRLKTPLLTYETNQNITIIKGPNIIYQINPDIYLNVLSNLAEIEQMALNALPEKIYLKGQAELRLVKNSEIISTLKSEQMILNLEGGLIEGSTEVSLSQGTIITKGLGFTINLKLKQLSIHNQVNTHHAI